MKLSRSLCRLPGAKSHLFPGSRRYVVLAAAMLAIALPSRHAEAQAVDPIESMLQAQRAQAEAGSTGTTSRVRVYPFRLKHQVDKTGPLTAATAPAGAHLTYNGGPVVGTIQIVIVLYGSGSYIPQLTSTTAPSMTSFYSTITNDGFMDLLSQYSTTGVNYNGTTTNQTIAHGGANSVVGTYSIAPSAANNGSTISDTQIQAELQAQIAAGHLPASTYDAAGNPNTIYMTYFPPGKTITQGGSSSCVSGGFCAYHGTTTNGGRNLLYGVMPDMQAGSGCSTGCGNSTTFGNYTSVSSHELAEAITDAAVGLAGAGNGPPLAWYDNTNGEIGDICNAQQGTLDGYTVQLEFSNAASNCVLPASGSAGNNFTITASPASLSVAQGASGSSSIATAVASGSAATVTLAVSGAPTGVTATLSPTSVTAGSSSTLSIATTATATAGTYTLTVTGTEGTISHAATVSLSITASGGGGGTGIVNGGFEAGNLSGWTPTGAIETISTTAHTGSYSAQMGSSSPTNGDSSIAQTFTAPTGATGISLYYKMTCPDTVTYDWAIVTLKDNTAGTTATLLPKTCATNAWTQITGTLVAGHSYTLTTTSHDDNYSGDPSFTDYDDATITTTGGGGGGTGVTNGGFESGVTGWTIAGASETIATAGCHGGTNCAKDGLATATNGDSSFSQTFTVPTGKTSMSVWYKMTCPDTVTYDWAIVTLKNNTAGTTATLLPKTCATNATWVNLTSAVTAGSSYTLTLTSHDDNYASDPSFTLFDDVTLN